MGNNYEIAWYGKKTASNLKGTKILKTKFILKKFDVSISNYNVKIEKKSMWIFFNSGKWWKWNKFTKFD